ncbi:folate transporter 1-like [Convolutriloba macropyga]|uniref:folate transporter 1-like n=1 Tax=Convolutriloba macropyga TaxID=536237 RepID=UPI003F527856
MNTKMLHDSICRRQSIQNDYERIKSSGSEANSDDDDNEPEVNVCRLSAIGLFVNKFVEGCFLSMIMGRNILYPFFGIYLNAAGNSFNSIPAVFATIWATKIFSAIFSDALPLFGKRRLPYMVIGWIIAASFLFSACLHEYPEPYYGVTNCTRNTSLVLNPRASESAFFYVLSLSGALFGVGIATVATDALTVEYAKREPLKTRDKVLAYLNIAQFFGALFATILSGFGLNSAEYGGSWCTSYIDFEDILLIYGVLCVICIFFTLTATHEFPVDPKKLMPIKDHLTGIWKTVQSSMFLKMAVYIFLSGCFADVQSSASVKIKAYYAGVQPITTGIVGALNSFLVIGSIVIFTKYFSNTDWRKVTIFIKINIILLTAFAQLITIFDVVRNQYFYLLADETSCTLFLGILIYIAINLSAELSNESQEATTYGLLATIRLLTNPISTAIGNSVSAPFDVVSNDRYIRDTKEDQWSIAYAIIATHVVNSVSVLTVYYFLPKNKFELNELKLQSTHSKKKGLVFVGVISVVFVLAITLIMLSAVPQTQCLQVVGGQGCSNKN